MTRNLQQTWRTGLVVVIAALYAWVGVSKHGPDQSAPGLAPPRRTSPADPTTR